MLVITHLGQTYSFAKKDEVETDQMFRDRCWWIVKNMHRHTPSDFKKLIALSHLWVSCKYLNVDYGMEVTDKLKSYEDVYVKTK